MRGVRKQAHPARPPPPHPGASSGSWSPRPPPARQPEDETRAPATLVDATFHATADAGSIPAVSISEDLRVEVQTQQDGPTPEDVSDTSPGSRGGSRPAGPWRLASSPMSRR